MATATQQPQTVAEFIRSAKTSDPSTLDRLLELSIAETDRLKNEAELARIESKELSEVQMGPDGLMAPNMAGLWRQAQMYAASTFVPEAFQNKASNCFVACVLAQRWKLEPLIVMQHIYLVHGKPGIDGQLTIAIINKSGLLDGRLRSVFTGDNGKLECTVSGTFKGDKEPTLYILNMAVAQAEGWMGKKDSKWQTMPKDMLDFRTKTWWVRHNAPECLMGFQTVEELRDTYGEEPQPFVTAIGGTTRADKIAQQQAAADEMLKPRTNGSTNGNGHKPAPVKTPSPDETNQDAGATQEEVAHAESHDGELPGEDQGPTKEEMLWNQIAEEMTEAREAVTLAAVVRKFRPRFNGAELKKLLAMSDARRADMEAAKSAAR